MESLTNRNFGLLRLHTITAAGVGRNLVVEYKYNSYYFKLKRSKVKVTDDHVIYPAIGVGDKCIKHTNVHIRDTVLRSVFSRRSADAPSSSV